MLSHPPIASHFLKPEAPSPGRSEAESEASLDLEVAKRKLAGGGMGHPTNTFGLLPTPTFTDCQPKSGLVAP